MIFIANIRKICTIIPIISKNYSQNIGPKKQKKKLKSFENRKIDWGDKIRLSMKKGCKYNITLIPMCMPIIFAKYDCAIKCYRRYYRSKKEINKWEWKNNKPAWY